MVTSCQLSVFPVIAPVIHSALHLNARSFVFKVQSSGSWHPLILVSLQAADVCGECFCTHLLIQLCPYIFLGGVVFPLFFKSWIIMIIVSDLNLMHRPICMWACSLFNNQLIFHISGIAILRSMKETSHTQSCTQNSYSNSSLVNVFCYWFRLALWSQASHLVVLCCSWILITVSPPLLYTHYWWLCGIWSDWWMEWSPVSSLDTSHCC